MFNITLPNTQDYHDLYALTGLFQGSSLIVTNNTGRPIRLIQTDLEQPIDESEGFPVMPQKTALVHGNNVMKCLCKGYDNGKIIIQELTSTVMPLTAVELPQDIVTSGIENFRRLQVDVGETGFFEGREFRALRKIRLASTGDKIVYKYTGNVEAILRELQFTVSGGRYQAHVWFQDNVTEDTAFLDSVPVFNKNNSQIEYRDYSGGKYVNQNTLSTGGTITIADLEFYRDYVELISSNSTSQRTTSSGGSGSQRYVPALNFYLEIEALNGPVRGTVDIFWEERPEGVK